MTHHKSHSEDAEKHPKQDFMVERIAFFSDAVIAIAITLLVLEIKIPHIAKEDTYDQVVAQLLELKYGFIELIVSFLVIAYYWQMHHKLFKHIQNYNNRLLLANMIFLLTIIFFPFTTSLFAESGNNPSVFSLGIKLFWINNILTLLSLCALYWLAFKKHKELTYLPTQAEDNAIKADMFLPLILYIVLFSTSFFYDELNTLPYIILAGVIGIKIVSYWRKGKKKVV